MGRRHNNRARKNTKAVQLNMADGGSTGSSGGTETISADQLFDGQWGPTPRYGRHLPSVQPPERFRDPVQALGAYELIPLVFACVQTIATNGAMLPVVIKRRGEVLPLEQPSKIRSLILKPNPMMAKFELLEAIFTYVELCGNAYLLKDEQDGYGRPRTLWPLYAALMQADVDPATGLAGYDYALGAGGVRFEIEDILHIKSFRPDNFYDGLGTAQAGARTLEEADNTAAWNASFFENGATIAGVLQTDEKTVPAPTINRISQEWRALAGGVKNAYKTVVLTSGLRYQGISVNPGDIGLKDIRTITRDDILMLFRMPPTKVGLYDHANYKAEQADRDFWYQCMQPRVLRVQAKLQELADLFGEGDEVILELPKLRDLQQLATIANSLAANPHVTRNEVREVLELPRDANGDTYRVGLNVVEEAFTPEQKPAAKGATGGKAVSAIHQDALTAALQRDKTESEQLAAKTLTSTWTRFFDAQQARMVATIEAVSKRAGGTRAMYAALSTGDEKGIKELWDRRSENKTLYAVGRITHAFAGERAAGWLKAAAGIEASWSPDDPLATQILQQLAKRPEFAGINETTRTAIAAALDVAEQRKYTAQQLIQGVPGENFAGINGVFDDARSARLQTILRTETAQAWNTAMLQLGSAYGVAKWLITDGAEHTTGPAGPDGLTCAERNGLIVDATAAAGHCRGSHPNCQVGAVPYYGDLEIGARR